jgi:hypothetical protein
VQTRYGGTSEIMKMIIARDVTQRTISWSSKTTTPIGFLS